MIKTTILNKIRRISGIHEAITRLYVIGEDVRNNAQDIKKLERDYDEIREHLKQTIDLLVADRDNTTVSKNQLKVARLSNRYAMAYTKKHPLVTVRIATYNKSKELFERCLPSVLSQSYKNIEVIIVGDHCTDDTQERIEKLNDQRIKFVNFPRRNTYPDDPLYRWFVAGSPGMNYGVELANGDWIAPIDDDDEFSPSHIETLVKLAQTSRAELVYGALKQINESNNEHRIIYSDPPELGKFSFQAALYPRALDFFQYDEQSWVAREPGDWNLCRRMLAAGVTFTSTKDVVGYLYMQNLADKKHYRRK